MSYAGPSRGRGAASAASTSRPTSPARSLRPAPQSRSDRWEQLALFGAGLALGVAVGAGAALLAAPRSGAETRAVLRARAGRVGRTTTRRGRDAWDDLRDEIRDMKRSILRRKARRAAALDLRREVQLDAGLD